MKEATKEAIERIKEAGFGYLKVELEANLGRDGESPCDYCDRRGEVECDNCEGDGYVETEDANGNVYHNIECYECSGEGMLACHDCAGEGTQDGYMELVDCERFMREYVGSAVDNRLIFPNYAITEIEEQEHNGEFNAFYADGSVDSEFTFTIKIDHAEDVLKWIEAFKALSDRIGNDLDVEGAGLHISVLPHESQGRYPVSGFRLDSAGLSNFEREVTRLLPALYFLASSGHQARALGYRRPEIGVDKYSAIGTHNGTCLEYRIFETCYDKPEIFYDYLEVIANTLKFYKDPQIKVKQIGKQFGLRTMNNTVGDMFSTPDQLRILNSTVKTIKPKNKSFKQLRKERNLNVTIKDLSAKERMKRIKLEADHKRITEVTKETLERPLSEQEASEVDWLMLNHQMTREQAISRLRRVSPPMSLRRFIRENLSTREYDYQIAT